MSEYIGNRYRIVKLLGKGGMADVYLAFDTVLKREVAVKVLKSDMADDPDALERFKREAGAVTRLSHPNIVDVYDVGDDMDKHYIIMEYVRGYTLKQLIHKRGPIPYKEAVWLMKQLTGALMEAHRNNVIHRDIKSQNVLIKDDGTVKLSDFGIALASGAMQLTHKDSVLGSVHYLAPELSKGKQATMQSDIYSLGIVFYELLTGDVPYKADTPVQVALMHIKGSIPSVRKFNPQIPQSVENIIIRSTAKDPKQRYRNAALMLKDLNECLRKEHLNDEPLVLDSPKEEANVSIHKAGTLTKKDPVKTALEYLPIVAISLISIIAIFFILYLTGAFGHRTRMVSVPRLTGLTITEARDLLADSSLEIDESRITWILTDDVDTGYIVYTSPNEAEEVEEGTKIKVTVSSGRYSILQDYTGKNYQEARDELRKLNFIVQLQIEETDDIELDGKVISQDPPARSKYDGSINNNITLTYAVSDSEIVIPDLIGWDLQTAIDYLEENNIAYLNVPLDKTDFSEEELANHPQRTVIRTSPELGRSFKKSEIDTVSIFYYIDED